VFQLQCMNRMRSPNWSSRRVDCRGGVPGFMENLYLVIHPVHRLVS
jgi:hypothetical protein